MSNIDKSGANNAGIEDFNKLHGKEEEGGIELRQCKYLNNIVEQDHRFIKKRTRPMQGFKKFDSAQVILSGIELLYMIRKGQLAPDMVHGVLNLLDATEPHSAGRAFRAQNLGCATRHE